MCSVSKVDQDFMCPLVSEESKGTGLTKQLHFLQVPMLAKCCGASACYECLKEYVSLQIA